MLELSVASAVAAVKESFFGVFAGMRDCDRMRLAPVEKLVVASMKEFGKGLWELYSESLVASGEEQAAVCRCGRKCERREEPVDVTVLGMSLTIPTVYYYCRSCRTGRNPVRNWLGIHDGSVSMGIEQEVAALGREMCFGETVKQMVQQHGIELDRTRAERITYRGGRQAVEYLAFRRRRAMEVAGASFRTEGVDQIEFTADGGGVPCGEFEVVADAEERTPARGLPKKRRPIAKREARLLIARKSGDVTERTVDLNIAPLNHPEVTGERMLAAAIEAGLGDNSAIHGVFDMGKWIHSQFEEQFGTYKKTALADLYHVLEYQAAAGKLLVPAVELGKWLHKKKEELEAGDWAKIVQELQAHRCDASCARDEHGVCHVVAAWRYLDNHKMYLDYPSAIAKGLPVGSGEAESGIRHLVRKRMDVAGAWCEENANLVMALISIDRSGWWTEFWDWCDAQDIEAWKQRQMNPKKRRSPHATKQAASSR